MSQLKHQGTLDVSSQSNDLWVYRSKVVLELLEGVVTWTVSPANPNMRVSLGIDDACDQKEPMMLSTSDKDQSHCIIVVV